MPNPQRISIDPDPPIHGQSLTVCYDFAGTNLQKVDLTLTFSPGGSTTIRLLPSAPCQVVLVPSTATSLEIVDGSGTSPSLVVEVE